jgi:peptide deformylase
MALREIIHFPDPRLKLKSKKVTSFTDDLKKLAQDLYETMQVAKGIGLAAIQIAEATRLLVIDIGDLSVDEKYVEGDADGERRLSAKKKISKLEVYVNPEIIESSGSIVYEEGCLSVPGVYSNVTRKERLKLRYQDLNGKTHEIETHGLRSIVLQHEMDHLDGIVFPDRLGPMHKMMLLKKYKKLQESRKEDLLSGTSESDDDEA